METEKLFSISENAKRQIASVCDQRKAHTGMDAIPALVWISSELNNGIVPSVVAVGCYDSDQRDELKNDLRIVDGIELVLAVSKEDESRFLNKTLDYRSNGFYLD